MNKRVRNTSKQGRMMDKIMSQREANSRANADWMKKKIPNEWKNERANEWPNEQIDDFRPHLFKYRLNWVRRIWGWRDEWYDTALWTQDSKFELWRSQYYPRSRRFPTPAIIWHRVGSAKLSLNDTKYNCGLSTLNKPKPQTKGVY